LSAIALSDANVAQFGPMNYEAESMEMNFSGKKESQEGVFLFQLTASCLKDWCPPWKYGSHVNIMKK
jgi:hypothetical protein